MEEKLIYSPSKQSTFKNCRLVDSSRLISLVVDDEGVLWCIRLETGMAEKVKFPNA